MTNNSRLFLFWHSTDIKIMSSTCYPYCIKSVDICNILRVLKMLPWSLGVRLSLKRSHLSAGWRFKPSLPNETWKVKKCELNKLIAGTVLSLWIFIFRRRYIFKRCLCRFDCVANNSNNCGSVMWSCTDLWTLRLACALIVRWSCISSLSELVYGY